MATSLETTPAPRTFRKGPSRRTLGPLEDLYRPIRGELAESEEILRRELTSEFPFVDRIARHGFHLGGKRLRPALLLLAGKTLGGLTEAHKKLAAAVEMIHVATLVHDDILDSASQRRGLETVHTRFGVKAGVLLGDLLFTRAFHLASELDSVWACRRIGLATNRVCSGELRQLGTLGDFELTELEYLSMIEGKTAELCACCCGAGAHLSGAGEQATRAIETYGRELGIAFQIVDDVLDLLGDEAQVGKSLGTDLAQLKPTLPLIRLLSGLPTADRSELCQRLRENPNQRGDLLATWLARSDAFEYSQEMAQRHAENALAAIEFLPENDATAALRRIPEFTLRRRW